MKEVIFPAARLMFTKGFLTAIRDAYQKGNTILQNLHVQGMQWPEHQESILKADKNSTDKTLYIIFTKGTLSLPRIRDRSPYQEVIHSSSKCNLISSSDSVEDLIDKCKYNFVVVIAVEEELECLGQMLLKRLGEIFYCIGLVSSSEDVKIREKYLNCINIGSGTNAVEDVLKRESLLALKPMIDILLLCHKELSFDKTICRSPLSTKLVESYKEKFRFTGMPFSILP